MSHILKLSNCPSSHSFWSGPISHPLVGSLKSSPSLALTVALAIFTIVVWANGLGSLLPILAAWLRIYPTVVSGPVMSTLVDATSLFIYFTVARFILGL